MELECFAELILWKRRTLKLRFRVIAPRFRKVYRQIYVELPYGRSTFCISETITTFRHTGTEALLAPGAPINRRLCAMHCIAGVLRALTFKHW